VDGLVDRVKSGSFALSVPEVIVLSVQNGFVDREMLETEEGRPGSAGYLFLSASRGIYRARRALVRDLPDKNLHY